MLAMRMKFWALAILGLLIAAILAFTYTARPIFKSTSISPERQEQIQKIDAGFEKLRMSNNSVEANAIEAQLFVDLSRAQLASSNLLFENAQKLADQRDFNGALLLYEKIQNFEPEFSEAYVNGAYMAFELGQKDRALAMLRRAVKIEPRHFAAWFGIGTILDEKSDIKGAKIAYENALYHNPNFDAAKRALFAIEAKTKGIDL